MAWWNSLSPEQRKKERYKQYQRFYGTTKEGKAARKRASRRYVQSRKRETARKKKAKKKRAKDISLFFR